jgi:hypothetical protein
LRAGSRTFITCHAPSTEVGSTATQLRARYAPRDEPGTHRGRNFGLRPAAGHSCQGRAFNQREYARLAQAGADHA